MLLFTIFSLQSTRAIHIIILMDRKWEESTYLVRYSVYDKILANWILSNMFHQPFDMRISLDIIIPIRPNAASAYSRWSSMVILIFFFEQTIHKYTHTEYILQYNLWYWRFVLFLILHTYRSLFISLKIILIIKIIDYSIYLMIY